METDDLYVLLVAGDHIRNDYLDLLRRLELPISAWADCSDAVRNMPPSPPVVAVLEVEHGGCSLLRDLRDHYSQEVPVVLVSANRTMPADVVAGLLLGADDYAAETMDSEEFLARVRRLMDRVHTTEVATPDLLRLASLTAREREILALTSEGLTQKQVASALGISIKTVGAHIQSLLQKLGVHSRVEAVALAVRAGEVGGVEPEKATHREPSRVSRPMPSRPAGASGGDGVPARRPAPRTTSR
ncbi:response regulator transcription factor [Microbacter sp. GSS18]|nr:response regulator transcription factor [Microbacter sp. GSS18]